MEQTGFAHMIPELLYFVNRKCTPTWRLEKGNIGFHDLTFVYGGRSSYRVDGIEYQLRKGNFVYIPADHIREADTCPEEPMQCYAANFRLHGLGGEGGHMALPFDRVTKTGFIGDFMNLYSQLDHIWVEKAYNHEMRARAVFMLILDKLICRGASGCPMEQEDSRLVKVKQYILEHYMDKIEISHLAKLVNLNPVYLGALFKQANGCTLKQYVNRIRINNAESLLSTCGYSVGEAALHSGFEDIFYFSKVYKSYKGYVPSMLIKGP